MNEELRKSSDLVEVKSDNDIFDWMFNREFNNGIKVKKYELSKKRFSMIDYMT